MIAKDLLYTQNDEWIKLMGEEALVGISDYAQSELGEIVYVDVQTVGETIAQGEAFGALDAVKTASDLFMPMSGEILEFNQRLENEPELVNNDPYGDGWMIKIRISDLAEKVNLLTPEQYEKHCNKRQSAHA